MATPSIVVAEDDETYREVLRTALTGEGYDVQITKSTPEITKTLIACLHPPEVLILDWHLPGGTAGVVIERLRAAGYTMPVIVVTASGKLNRVRTEALSAGATLVWDKVESLEHLLSAVQRFIALQVDPPPDPVSPRQLLWLDTQRHTVIRLQYPYPRVTLTRTQTDMLRILLESSEPTPTIVLASRTIRYDRQGTGSRAERMVRG